MNGFKYTRNNVEALNNISMGHDVRGSVHRNTNLIERTNKMRPCIRIYYSSVS